MEIAMVIAFVVVAGGPLLGIWQAHTWAKSQGLAMRRPAGSNAHNQAA